MLEWFWKFRHHVPRHVLQHVTTTSVAESPCDGIKVLFSGPMRGCTVACDAILRRV
jgi:hypothetical protein